MFTGDCGRGAGGAWVIAALLACMTVWELARPGGAPRRRILGLDTTRGDRLFISLLGSAYIHLAWLAFVSPSLWAALAISLVFAAGCTCNDASNPAARPRTAKAKVKGKVGGGISVGGGK